MASIIQVGDNFRAQVRRAGHRPQTKTFNVKDYPSPAAARAEAEKWARKIESDVDAGKNAGVHGQTGVMFGDAVDRYLKQEKDLSKTATDILGYLKKGLGHIRLDKMTDEDIVNYIENKNFGPMSGAMHFSFFRSVLKMAKVGWKYYVPEIVEHARDRLNILGLIGKSEERTRRPTKEELEKLASYKFPTPIPMADIIEFAYTNGMRQAEITRICHGTIKEEESKRPTVVITDRKHPTKKKGNHQTVPLLDRSMEIIKKQKKVVGDDRIFPYDPSTVGKYFTDACKALGIVDLRFHDLRHEAASRLFELGFTIEQVALFTGHTDWKMLRRYTHLKPENVPQLEAKKERKEKKKKEEPVKAVEGGIVIDAEQFKQFQQFQMMMKMMKEGEPA